MYPFTEEQYTQLLENGKPENRYKDNLPVVLLRLSLLPCYWLLTHFCEDTEEVFGLCDLGLGRPELASVELKQLLVFRSLTNVTSFIGKYPLSVYAEASKEICTMPLVEEILEVYFERKEGGSKPAIAIVPS